MAMINEKIQLDFTEEGLREKIEVVQGDTGRVLVCNVIGVDMTNVSARFYAIKKSGKEIYNNCLVAGNKVTIDLTEQTLAETGIVKCQLDLRKGSQKVQSFIFNITVTESLMAQSEYLSSNEYRVIDNLAGEVEDNKNKIAELDDKKANKDDYGSPLTASTVSAMTDKKKVYVYTGSESGYTAGNWYSWNGTAWVPGGVYNSAAIQTDKTLTQSGKAADSAIVGQQIGELKEFLVDLTKGILGFRAVRNEETFIMDGTVNPSDNQYPQKGLLYEYDDLISEKIITGGNSLFNSESDFTVFAVVDKQIYTHNIIGLGDNKGMFTLFVNWNGDVYIKLYLNDNSAYPQVKYTPSDSDSLLYLCVTKNENTYTLYVNNTNIDSTYSNGKQNINNDDLHINSTKQKLNKLLIYDRCLTSNELTSVIKKMKEEEGE